MTFDRQTPRRRQQQQPASDRIARLQQQQSGSNEFRGPPQAQSGPGGSQPQQQMGGEVGPRGTRVLREVRSGER